MSSIDLNKSSNSSSNVMNNEIKQEIKLQRANNSSFRLPEGLEEEFKQRVSILRQMSSEQLLNELKRDLDEDEVDLVHKVSQQIVYLQKKPVSWLGNIVRRIRRALGNPTDDDVETIILPPANDILKKAKRKQELFKRRFGRGPKAEIERGLDQTALENILSLDDALDGSLRFLLAYKLYQAKSLLSLALRIYPQDLRLYKLYGWIILRDRTLNWQAVRLQQGLFFFDRLQEPDAEIWALRGDIGRALWNLERGQRHLVEQALVCYTQSFQMAQQTIAEPGAYTYAIRKAAVLSSEVYALSMRESEVNQQAGIEFRRQTQDYLEKLLKACHDSESRHTSSELYDWYFAKLFALMGLSKLDEANNVCKLLAKELDMEKSTDDLAEETTKDLFDSLVKIVLFSGVSIPHRDEDPKDWHYAWKVIRDLFSHGARGTTVTRELLASSVRGRIGLSLSGGGLRAAFMHLGLLARLAECGMLKPVASISCVSGGCLVGAHLYQLVKHLLESKYDDEIKDIDYIKIVQDMIKHFWNATHHDMYANTLINPIRNLRIAFGKLRRIQLLGDEFHEKIFRHVYHPNDKNFNIVKWEKPWRMRDSVITPKGWNPINMFAPRVHNWRRTNKAPALYLNATNLNTGHLFRFTGLYMGEKADMHGGDLGVNRNSILESVRYSEIENPKYRNIAFADCVAISQLYPGIFDPYELKGLYGDLTVKLIDGGIFDNAGLASLLHANTDYLIANEMSAILKDLNNPSSGALSVLLRVLDISGDLNFERVLRYLKDRLQNWGVKDICFVHSQQVDLMTPAQREALYYHRRIPAKRRDLRKRVISRMLHKHKKSSDDERKSNDSIISTISEIPNMLKLNTNDSNIGAERTNTEDWPDDTNALVHDNAENKGGLDLSKILHSYLVEFRTSVDVITDVEKSALMATGYRLACEALEQSAKSALSGGQFFRLVDVVPPNVLSPSSRNTGSFDFKDNIPDKLQPLAQLTGCGNGEWAFFDVCAPKRDDWVFGPMGELLKQAENVPIPSNSPYQYSDHEKLAREIRDELEIEKITENPALQDLYCQLKLAPIQFSVTRMLKLSWRLAIGYVLLPVLIVIALYSYGVYDFADFLDRNGSLSRRTCLCLLERPLFYLLLFLTFIILFIRPGYVSRILIATIVMPFYYFGTTMIFDPYLLRRGDLTTLVDLNRKFVASKVSDVLATPRQKS